MATKKATKKTTKTAAKKSAKKTDDPKATTKSAKGKTLHAGDPVEWGSSGGKAVGKVVKKVTKTTKVKGHVAKATPDHPEYLVQSDKSGGKAVHKSGELKKKSK